MCVMVAIVLCVFFLLMMMLKMLFKPFFGQDDRKDMYIDLNETDGILYPKFRNEIVMARVVVVVVF